jgi:hypothetical protein
MIGCIGGLTMLIFPTCTAPYDPFSCLVSPPIYSLLGVLLMVYHDQTEIRQFGPYSTSLTHPYSLYNLIVVMQLAWWESKGFNLLG